MVMDSLRYWVQEMHVDGFRFDLAPVLGRADDGFDARARVLPAVAQDPLLPRVKLIAEPWDLGPGGYRLGGFPRGWLEWNDRFRDTRARLLARPRAPRGEFARALAGSSDLFDHGPAARRRPASTSSPRTTASRCATWSATSSATTTPTAKTTATATATT